MDMISMMQPGPEMEDPLAQAVDLLKSAQVPPEKQASLNQAISIIENEVMEENPDGEFLGI